MGFWSALGKIGAGIAAPFTGGASLAAIPLIDAIGSATNDIGQQAGNQAGAAAQGRLAEGAMNQRQDQNALDFFKTQYGAALNTPGALAHQIAAGDNLANIQDVNIGGLPSYIHVPTISGGLRPSNLGPNSRQAGAQVSRNALVNLMANKYALPNMPTQTPLPEPSGYDSTMKWLGRGAGLASAASPLFGAFGGGQTGPSQFPSLYGGGSAGDQGPYAPPDWGSIFGGGASGDQGPYFGG